MRTIGIIYNPLSERTEQQSQTLATWIEQQGLKAWVGTSQTGRDHPEEVEKCDLLVAMALFYAQPA